MVPPAPPAPTRDAATRPVHTIAAGLAGVLIALNAFALGASGSLSALAGLTEASLIFAGMVPRLFGERWKSVLPDFDADAVESMGQLVLSGMALAAATFVGLMALSGIFDPRPVGGGFWPATAIVGGLAVRTAMIAYDRRTTSAGVGHRVGFTDAIPGLVVLIGVVAGTVMNAPGLDAAAALVVAVWLFWGAFGPIRSAAIALGARPTSG